MPIDAKQAVEGARDARRNIAGIAIRTPLLNLGDELFLKLESLQPIGSFKIRGAANFMARAGRDRIARGVLTASAGNMAQGVAYCARRMGVPATVVTPDTAPETKLKAVERLGGRIIKAPFDIWWRTFEQRSYPGVDAEFVHAFDHPDVWAGNGTIGLELLEDLPDLDAIVIPWGGGGLACGIAAVVRELRPSVKIYAAEIETGAPLAASLAAGRPVNVEYTASFVDGISAKMVFPGMFERAKALLDGSFVMTLQEAAAAIRFVAGRGRLVCEGAAACAVAAALSGKAGKGKVVAILSGGNIDMSKLAELIK
jgi:threonine dehydratase